MPAGTNFPRQFGNNAPRPREVLAACQWLIEEAEAGRNMPDLSRNPNSKLAVIKRCAEEITRNRRQIEYLVVENKVLKDLLLAKDPPCAPTPAPAPTATTWISTGSAHDAEPTLSSPKVVPPPA